MAKKSDTRGRSRPNNNDCRDSHRTLTSEKKEEECDSPTNGSPISNINGAPTPTIISLNPTTTAPTTKTNILLIGFILFGIIFCECVFYDSIENVVENVIIDNLVD